jgi:antitoxin (DNA-binding transcriptional repressor) of toxin-antitoxin stability system
MITATISKTKDHLSEYLKQIQAGETLVITDRKTPVARVEAIRSPLASPHVSAPARCWNPDEVLSLPLAQSSQEKTLAAAVEDERSESW